jgi:hypothetical protein
MADSTSAVVRWSARSATVGTPRGRFSVFARLGDIDPPNVRRAISLAVDGLEHRLYPALEALVCTENLKSEHSGDEVRPGWRVN